MKHPPHRRVLITGSGPRIEGLDEAFEELGIEVVRVEHLDPDTDLSATLGPQPLDGYVQLPAGHATGPGGPLQRVHDFLTVALLERFEAARTVLPALAPAATIVLVAGDQPAVGTPDDPHARFDLLRVLARAFLADQPDVHPVVVGSRHTGHEIARIATGHSTRPGPTRDAALDTEGNHADWTQALLALTAAPHDPDMAVEYTRGPGGITEHDRRPAPPGRPIVIPLPPAAPSGAPNPAGMALLASQVDQRRSARGGGDRKRGGS